MAQMLPKSNVDALLLHRMAISLGGGGGGGSRQWIQSHGLINCHRKCIYDSVSALHDPQGNHKPPESSQEIFFSGSL